MKPIYVAIFAVLLCFCMGNNSAFGVINNPEITYVARTPSPSPNVIAKGENYIYHGDGSVIAIYNSSDLTLAGRFEVQIGLEPDRRAGTQGITGLVYDDTNKHLYVTCGNEGLQIYDVGSNATAPPLLGTWLVDAHWYDNARARAKDVFVEHRAGGGDYAYIVYKLYTGQDDGHRTGIQIVDISDPTNPFFVGECGTPGAFALGLAGLVEREQAIYVHYDAARGHQAYITDYSNGLAVYDVDDPANPTHEAWSAIVYAIDVTVAGDYAWVAVGGYGLWAVPLPDDDAGTKDVIFPVSQCQYNVQNGASYTLTTSVEVSGDYAYLSDGLIGLVVIDISDLDAIDTEVGEDYDLTGLVTAYGVDMSGAYCVYVDASGIAPVAYITNYINGLQKITIADGQQNNTAAWDVAGVDANNLTPTPSDVDAFALDQEPSINKSYIYTVDDDPTSGDIKEGFTVHFVSFATDWINFYYKGFLATNGEARDVCVSGDYAYVADGSAGLKVINPGLPDIIDGWMETEKTVNPTLTGSCAIGAGSAAKVCVAGDYACVAAEEGGLYIIDVSDPTAPWEAGHIGNADGIPDARAVDAVGDYAYVAGGMNGLQVVDASDPSNPVLAAECWLPGITVDVSVADDKAYLACRNTGETLAKYDGTNWQSYTPVIPLDVDAIAVDGNIAWVGTNYKGIRLFDIGNQAWLRAYTTDDGLADDDVEAIAIDSSGNAWCGTAGGGVSMFDDTTKTWTTYTTSDDRDDNDDVIPENIDICGDDIEAITIDTSDTVWIGTQKNGVSVVDTLTMTWTTCTTEGTSAKTAECLANNEIEGIAIDSAGKAWIVSDASDGDYTCEDTDVDGICDTVEYGSNRGGVTCIDVHGAPGDSTAWTWVTYYPGDELPASPRNTYNAYNEIETIAIDAYDRVWIGSEGHYWDPVDQRVTLVGGGVTLFDPGTGTWQNSESWTGYPTDDEGLFDRVIAIAADTDNDIMWFGTYGGGVIQCDMSLDENDPGSWIFTTYNVGEDGVIDDLPDNWVQCITVDGAGNAWFGFFPGQAGFYGGLFQIDISDPLDPVVLDDYYSGYYQSIYGVFAAVSNEQPQMDLIWVANGDRGLGFFKETGTLDIQQMKTYDTSGFVKQTQAYGSFAVLAEGAGGVQVAGVGEVNNQGTDWMDGTSPDFSRDSKSIGCFVESIFSRPFLKTVSEMIDKLF